MNHAIIGNEVPTPVARAIAATSEALRKQPKSFSGLFQRMDFALEDLTNDGSRDRRRSIAAWFAGDLHHLVALAAVGRATLMADQASASTASNPKPQ